MRSPVFYSDKSYNNNNNNNIICVVNIIIGSSSSIVVCVVVYSAWGLFCAINYQTAQHHNV